jgi:multidrug efflux pump subunit AcrA (membrane-fusion protein)
MGSRYQRLARERQREIEALQADKAQMQAERTEMESNLKAQLEAKEAAKAVLRAQLEATQAQLEATQAQLEATQAELNRVLAARRVPSASRHQQWVQALKELSGRVQITSEYGMGIAFVSSTGRIIGGTDFQNLSLGVRFLTSKRTVRDFANPRVALTDFQVTSGRTLDEWISKVIFTAAHDAMKDWVGNAPM